MESSALGMCVLLVGAVVLTPAQTQAHWCSNIYNSYSRLVVKPERQNINIADGSSGTLQVRVRNNFPYGLRWIKLRANNPAGLDVTISPTQTESENTVVQPGMELTSTLSITRTAAGPDDVSELNLEVRTEVQNMDGGWRDSTDWWVDQNPTESDVRNSIANPQQTRSLLHDSLSRLSCAGCETDGFHDTYGLITMFAERVTNSCRSDFHSQWPQMFIRAGLFLGIHARFSTFTEINRSDVVQAFINGMDDQYHVARGFAAFLAAYGGNDPGVQTRIEDMMNSDPDYGSCGFSSHAGAQRMARAALLVLGLNQYHQDVTDCYNDGGEEENVRFACAAALGMVGEDAPMVDFLIPNTTDGYSMPDPHGYDMLYGSYLIQLVVLARRGGPDGVGVVSFLNETVVQDDVPPEAPTNLVASAP